MTELLSPTTGRPLRPDGPATLSDGRERWPVMDGIPYLRTGRDELVREVVARLDRGEADAALACLLRDQDDWWDGPTPGSEDVLRLIRERDALSLREAMARLSFGRVGDYFAHRWSDPTYLAGLALLDAHWSEPTSAFELACGIGHYLRDLEALGVRVTGSDVVFSKLWLARHWVVGPSAELICFDASSAWPLSKRRFDLVLCQDAFYFLEPKPEIAAHLRALAAGPLAIGHIHNSEAENLSAGRGMDAAGIDALFPGARIYDDDELTRAAGDGRPPSDKRAADLRRVEAFSLVDGAEGSPRPADGPLCRPQTRTGMRRNPLYRGSAGDAATITWPSERYGQEYADRATFPLRTELPEYPSTWSPEQARRREVVSLPTRW